MKRLASFSLYLEGIKRLSPFSVRAYTDDIAHFTDWHNGPITDVNVNQFVCMLTERGYAASSIRRKVAAIRAYSKFLMLTGGDSSLHAVSVPKMPQRLPKSMSGNDISTIFLAVRRFSLRDRCIVNVLYSAGLRVGECVSLRIRDIDFKKGILSVNGKRDRQRMVPVSSDTLMLLRSYLSESSSAGFSGDRPLFISRSGTRLSRRMVQLVIKRACQAAGLSAEWSAHSFRHSAATHLLDDGAQIRDVQAFLGHQRIATTQLYTHVARGHLRAVFESAHPRRI
ncbi:hypothetical protein EBR96_02670 [bacterium]|nr:hypothetical protein [bacterium]